jgi:hypothetical protein
MILMICSSETVGHKMKLVLLQDDAPIIHLNRGLLKEM